MNLKKITFINNAIDILLLLNVFLFLMLIKQINFEVFSLGGLKSRRNLLKIVNIVCFMF